MWISSNVGDENCFARTDKTTNDGLCSHSNSHEASADDQQPQRSSAKALLAAALLFVGSGLRFCAANFRKERLGGGWDWHFAQQQRPSGDVSVDCVPGITVLAERCAF